MAPASADAHDLHDGPDFVERVRRSLQGVAPDRREASIESWVGLLRTADHLPRAVALLSGAPEPEIRYLAARLAAGLAPPIKRALRSVLRRLLQSCRPSPGIKSRRVDGVGCAAGKRLSSISTAHSFPVCESEASSGYDNCKAVVPSGTRGFAGAL